MHIIQVLYDHVMRHPVKCFTEVHKCNNNSMRLFQVKVLMDKLEKLDEIMADRGTFKPILARINVWANYWHKPFS